MIVKNAGFEKRTQLREALEILEQFTKEDLGITGKSEHKNSFSYYETERMSIILRKFSEVFDLPKELKDFIYKKEEAEELFGGK